MTTEEKTKDKIWDVLLANELATEDEMRLVTNINGYTVETMESIIYVKTGVRNLDQLKGEGYE